MPSSQTVHQMRALARKLQRSASIAAGFFQPTFVNTQIVSQGRRPRIFLVLHNADQKNLAFVLQFALIRTLHVKVL